ncbi:MAG: hypothetical protein ACC656_09865, partial [Candidatus Heimdallarchaeota archaeon]
SEAIIVLLAGKFTKTRSNRSWLSIFVLLEGIVFFGSFALLLYFVPFTNTLEIKTIVVILILFVIADFIGLGGYIIRKKIYIDLIPNETRNSFYSLETTIIVFVASPLMIIVGYVIDNYGFSPAVAVLGVLPIVGALLIYFGRNEEATRHKSLNQFNPQ